LIGTEIVSSSTIVSCSDEKKLEPAGSETDAVAALLNAVDLEFLYTATALAPVLVAVQNP
jgi:hypothetical protein